MKTARSFRHPIIAIIWAALHVVPLTGEVVPIGGGGNPHYPEAPVPAADMARLKKNPPFRGMTDANVQEKIVRIRLNLLDSIAVVRAENPAIAECLQKQFDANRIYIDFANSHASGSIVHDRLPECNAEAITIGVAKLPCDRLPAYDLQMAELTGTLLHEGLHGIQDWRPTPDAPQPPVTDVDQAKKWEAYHCREKEASDLEVQSACELIEVLDEVAAGNPIPPTARGRAKAIGESITGDAQLTADQKKAAAARLLADTKLLKEGYHLIAACREQIKNAYRDFINGTLSKPQLNRTLSINGWFLHYGGVGGFGPKICLHG